MPVCVREGVSVLVSDVVEVLDTVLPGVNVCDGVTTSGVGVCDVVTKGEMVRDVVTTGVPVCDGVTSAVREGVLVTAGVTVREGETPGVIDTEGVDTPVGVTEGLTTGVTERVPVPVRVLVTETVEVKVNVGVGDCSTDDDGEGVGKIVVVSVFEPDAAGIGVIELLAVNGLLDTDAATPAVDVSVGLLVTAAVSDDVACVIVAVGDFVTADVTELVPGSEAVRERDCTARVNDAEGVAAIVNDCDGVNGVPDDVAVSEVVLEKVRDPVPEIVGLIV